MIPVLFPTVNLDDQGIKHLLNNNSFNEEFNFQQFSEMLRRLVYAKTGMLNTACITKRMITDLSPISLNDSSSD